MYQPQPKDYAPYYTGYIQLVQGDIMEMLDKQQQQISNLLELAPAAKQDYAYAPGKWTVKEVIAHLIDTERVMVYRTMCFARNDKAELPGFDENDYIANSRIAERKLEDLVNEFLLMRKSNMYFFKSLNEADYAKNGNANGNNISVGALLFIVAGHVAHHLNVLKERYL